MTKSRRYIISVFLIHLLLVSAFNGVVAQNTSLEFWPETDLWYRLSPSWRLSAFIPVTKYHESKDRDLNIYLQADYAWGRNRRPFYTRLFDDNRAQMLKAWMVRPGYMTGQSLGDQGENYSEQMLFAELHQRIPLKSRFLISHRLRSDFRWLGEDSEFSYRIRYRFMIERELISGKTSFVPYVNIEPFYDSRYDFFNRIRVIGGATFAWKSWFALEGNLTYQYDEKYATSNVYALNLILHLFFEKRRSKTQD